MIAWLANQIRAARCVHEFEWTTREYAARTPSGRVVEAGLIKHAVCLKCGWHMKRKLAPPVVWTD